MRGTLLAAQRRANRGAATAVDNSATFDFARQGIEATGEDGSPEMLPVISNWSASSIKWLKRTAIISFELKNHALAGRRIAATGSIPFEPRTAQESLFR